MDVIAKGVLSFIQQEKKYAVLAGGAVRDSIFKIEPKDYDIFVPINGLVEQEKIINAVVEEFAVKKLQSESREYALTATTRNIKNVLGFNVEGKEFDIIFVKEPDDDEFTTNLLKTFDFGVNMVTHDGNFLDDSNPLFNEDRNYGRMTLHNLKAMSQLPKMIEKFNRINQRYGGGWIFGASCLMLVNEEKPEKKKLRWADNPLPAPPEPIAWAPQAAPQPAHPDVQAIQDFINQMGLGNNQQLENNLQNN